MDMIRFFCNKCGARIKVPASAAGKDGKCPNCGTLNKVPAYSNVDADLEARLHRAKHGIEDEVTADSGDSAVDALHNVVEDAGLGMGMDSDDSAVDAQYDSRVEQPAGIRKHRPEDVSGILSGGDESWDSPLNDEVVELPPGVDDTGEHVSIDDVMEVPEGAGEKKGLGIDYSEFDERKPPPVHKDYRGSVWLAGAILLLLGGLTWAFLTRGGGGSDLEYHYFYDTTTEQLFVRTSEMVPPITAPSGGRGLRAFVYSCGSCGDEDSLFAGYLERYTYEGKQAERLYRERRMEGVSEGDLEELRETAEQNRQLLLPGGTQLLPWDSDEAEKIRSQVSCPDGGEPKPCAAPTPSG